jgi:hypothetical protein
LNNCFVYSFIKCGTAPSGTRTLDGVFNTLSKLDLYSMFDDPQLAIDKATELAYNSMTSALISKEGKSVNKNNEILGDRFTSTYNSIQNHYFYSSPKKYYRLNKAWVNVNFTGTINIKLVNELAVVELVPVVVVAGITKEIVLNKSYRYVEVSINENVQGRSTYGCGISGMLLDYSILCDYHSFICSNKDLFQVAMDYKVASILLTDGVFSGEIGQRIMQSEDYDNLKKEYEIEYERELDKLSIKESGCFDCGSKIQAKSWLV